MAITGMAYADNWVGYCSEETEPCSCSDSQAMAGMWCTGNWCDNNYAYCRTIGTKGNRYWTPAQYDNGTLWCSPGYVPQKLDCHGGYCSGISFDCVNINNATGDTNCTWTDVLGTDESGNPYTNYGQTCGTGKFVHGSQIFNYYGSKRKLYCCNY